LVHGNVQRGVRGTQVSGLTRDVTLRRQSEERERILAGVTRALAAAPGYDGMLSELARLAVSDLGDWCFIDVADEDGSVRNVVVAPADPRKVESARAYRRRVSAHPGE